MVSALSALALLKPAGTSSRSDRMPPGAISWLGLSVARHSCSSFGVSPRWETGRRFHCSWDNAEPGDCRAIADARAGGSSRGIASAGIGAARRVVSDRSAGGAVSAARSG